MNTEKQFFAAREKQRKTDAVRVQLPSLVLLAALGPTGRRDVLRMRRGGKKNPYELETSLCLNRQKGEGSE